MLDGLNLREVEVRDARYDCVVHLVTAAKGAEKFYTTIDNSVRKEGIPLACELDDRIRNAWLGHPYMDVVDNSTGFEEKLHRVVEAVCRRLGVRDNRAKNITKRKFLVDIWPTVRCAKLKSKRLLMSNLLTFRDMLRRRLYLALSSFHSTYLSLSHVCRFVQDAAFTCQFQDFEVHHSYLPMTDGTQARIRKRGQNGVYTYTLTIRRESIDGQQIETRRNLSSREYEALLAQVDPHRLTALKMRRCFVFKEQYMQLDLYKQPMKGLMLLEAYVSDRYAGPAAKTFKWEDLEFIPPFIHVVKEVTANPDYFMYKLCQRDEGENEEMRNKA
jgi:hypothetical protein